MLDEKVVHGCLPTRITGWRFETEDGRPRVRAANETHAKIRTGNHRVFNVGKPEFNLGDIHDLKRALIDVGVL